MLDNINEIVNQVHKISYGWIDKNNIKHTNSKIKYFMDNYQYMSIDEVLKYNIGTCFEKANLCKYYLEEKGITSNIYMIDYDVEEKLAKHTICVTNDSKYYYLVESSWIIDFDIRFDSLEQLLNKVIDKYPKMYKIEGMDRSKFKIYKIDNIPSHVSFNEYLRLAKNNIVDISGLHE
jgi:hypothetical protein